MPAAPDSIFALASGHGRAGVSVVRLSGPRVMAALASLTRKKPPPPRLASVRRLYDPQSGALLDEALILVFAAPASFTGEDVVELHLHGGRAVVASVLEVLSRIKGLRGAEPGEFTRRAFEQGRMDLTEAEAINDLVMAETAAQQQQALRQMGGALGRIYEDWRLRLMNAYARIEADIDFPDEDLPEDMVETLRPDLMRLLDEISTHLGDDHRGERLREGVSIVLLGAPNVGKSSLLNALSKKDAAIVSDIAGTTRDVIEVQMNLSGYPASLIDTAGIREAGDSIESEGVRRALDKAHQADIRVLLLDAAAHIIMEEDDSEHHAPVFDLSQLPADLARLRDDADIILLNKADQLGHPPYGHQPGDERLFVISVTADRGIADVLEALSHRVMDLCDVREAPALTRIRHRQALEEAQACLQRYMRADADHRDPVLAAEDIRMAARAVGRITGRVDVESMLDIVFSSFCIGK
ncbi:MULTISPECIES: tRNA uridine-5-carboxymethylaminomethyl(34) synthesis GTPase MnmE [unclassified Iodidimonas]|jgi:tRNA modification GTPase|uniref:tRNA uridine-5-carboxymethylaminomethyl(34) synthesis GTPase MnmE n=1 Tax=unclassified Iodidimonas TaxID=2626145 RepID=UPI002482D14B|nr:MULTISPECIES: tRNA uridine-5-carboxymethylaminomethyl(34) synthesis GTPase MnmE [unclassified Iodidimonas]